MKCVAFVDHSLSNNEHIESLPGIHAETDEQVWIFFLADKQ